MNAKHLPRKQRRRPVINPCLWSTGVLHGLHGDEAIAALRHGQQSLLCSAAAAAAAGRRTVPRRPAVHLTSAAQISNGHAGEEPNGHGHHAVPSAAGMSTNPSFASVVVDRGRVVGGRGGGLGGAVPDIVAGVVNDIELGHLLLLMNPSD